MMHGQGQSDRPVVPTKSPNKPGEPGAEGMEGRGLAKGNPSQQNAPRAQHRDGARSALERVREVAERDKTVCGSRRSCTTSIQHRAPAEGVLRAEARRRRRRRHDPIPAVGTWLRQVVGGHIRYYGVPMNSPAIALFRFQVGWLWHRALARRSHTGHVAWERMRRLIERWLPPARICHPYPLRRLGVVT
jgi:hypothetical protein